MPDLSLARSHPVWLPRAAADRPTWLVAFLASIAAAGMATAAAPPVVDHSPTMDGMNPGTPLRDHRPHGHARPLLRPRIYRLA